MAIAEFELPDGSIAELEFPDHWSDERIQREGMSYIAGDNQISPADEASHIAESISNDNPLNEVYEGAGILAGHVNKGLVGNFIDLPFNVLNLALGSMGVSQRAALPTEMLPANINPFETTSINPELADTLRPVGIGLEFASGSAFPLAVMSKVASAQKAVPVASGIKGVAGRTPAPKATFAQKATTSAALKKEAIASAASGTGATTASFFSDGDPVMELLAGMGTPFGVLAGVSAGNRLITKPAAIFKQSSQNKVAIQTILEHADDSQAALASLGVALKAGKSGSLGQLTKDKGLLGFEKMLAGRPGGARLRLDSKDAEAVEQIIGVIDDLGGRGAKELTEQYFDGKFTAIRSRIDGRVQDAGRSARSALERTGTDMADADASVVLRQQLDEAFDEADKIHKAAWADIPDVDVDVSGLHQAFTDKLDEVLKTIPAKRRGKIGFSGVMKDAKAMSAAGKVDVHELIDLRSGVLADLRRLKNKVGADKFQKLAATELQGVLFKAIDDVPVANKAYRHAADLTKHIDATFTQAAFDSVDEAALSSKVFMGGNVGGQRADELMSVMGYNQGVFGATEDVIRAKFVSTAAPKGVLDVKKADKFIGRHGEFLRRFPGLKGEIDEPVRTESLSNFMLDKQKATNEAIQKSAANLFIELDDPVRAIDNLFLGKFGKAPKKYAAELYRRAKMDKSGDATRGLQRMSVDSLMKRVINETGSDFNRNFKTQYNTLKPVLKEVFKDNPDALPILDDVMDDIAAKLSKKSAPIPHDALDDELLISTVGAIGGARAGAQFGTTPLIAATVGRKIAQKIFTKLPRDKTYALIEEMVVNPSQFDEGIKGIQKAATEDEVMKIIAGWFMNMGVQASLVETRLAEE